MLTGHGGHGLPVMADTAGTGEGYRNRTAVDLMEK
jgi:hypothetical protein